MNVQKIRLNVEVHPMDVVSSLSHDEGVEFIKNIDLSFADVGFTEKVVTELIKSMKDDLSEEEWKPYQKLLDSLPPF